MECEGEQCERSSDGCDDRFMMAMMIVKRAKMELLKEKVKKKLEEVDGKRLDKVADLIVEVMLDQRKTHQDMEKRYDEMKDRFDALHR